MVRVGGVVAEKSVLKHLTVCSDRKRIKFVHQSATERFVIGPQRLFEQLLNSSRRYSYSIRNRIGQPGHYSGLFRLILNSPTNSCSHISVIFRAPGSSCASSWGVKALLIGTAISNNIAIKKPVRMFMRSARYLQ